MEVIRAICLFSMVVCYGMLLWCLYEFSAKHGLIWGLLAFSFAITTVNSFLTWQRARKDWA